ASTSTRSASLSSRSRTTTPRGTDGSPPKAYSRTRCFTRNSTPIPSASPPACSGSSDSTSPPTARSPSSTGASRTSSTPGGSKATAAARHRNAVPDPREGVAAGETTADAALAAAGGDDPSAGVEPDAVVPQARGERLAQAPGRARRGGRIQLAQYVA